MSEAAATPAPAQSAPPPVCPYLDPENAPLPKSGWLRRWPWVTVLLPFIIFMLFNMVEPSPPDPKVEAEVAELTKKVEEGNAAERNLAQGRLNKIHEEQSHK